MVDEDAAAGVQDHQPRLVEGEDQEALVSEDGGQQDLKGPDVEHA